MNVDLNLIIFWLTSLFLAFTAALLITRGRPRSEPQICGSKTPVPQPVNPPVPMNIQQPYSSVGRGLDSWEPPGSHPNRVLIELELPEIPRYIRVNDPAILSRLLRDLGVLEEDNEEASRPQVDNAGRDVFHGDSPVSRPRGAPSSDETIESFSTRGHHDNPILDLVETVTGLEFSPDGRRIRCPLHGWSPYTITSAGDIICNSGPHLLWSSSHPSTREFMKLLREAQLELTQLEDEAGEKKKMMKPMKKQRPGERRIEDVEDEEDETPQEVDEEDSA